MPRLRDIKSNFPNIPNIPGIRNAGKFAAPGRERLVAVPVIGPACAHEEAVSQQGVDYRSTRP
jgi:hypothetical protein